MSVQLGDIKLTRLRTMHVDEGRNLVEHQLPGDAGSVFQDLGRRAVGLYIEGVLLGEQALVDIESLRTVHAQALPLSFSADVAIGSDLTDVIIEHFRVWQVPGHRFRFEFALRVREWREPPAPPELAIQAVDSDIGLDADRFADQAFAIGGALEDVGALAGLLRQSPNLLARIDVGEMTEAVVGNIGKLAPMDFVHLVRAVASADVDSMVAMVATLGQAGTLADLVPIMAGEGQSLLEQITGLDLAQAPELVNGFLGGPALLDQLATIRDTVERLTAELQAFEPLPALSEVTEPAGVVAQGVRWT